MIVKTTKDMMFVMFLMLCVALVFSGCATRRVTSKQIVLSDMPVYKSTRTNWNTLAKCMVYPMISTEKNKNISVIPVAKRGSTAKYPVKRGVVQGKGVVANVLQELGINNISSNLEEMLKQQGYQVVEMDTYMSSSKRNSIDKIIIPMAYSMRSRVVNSTNIWDVMVIYSVQEGPEYPFDETVIPPRRYFQIWSRSEANMPYHEAVKNLFNVDGFRVALQEEIK